MSVARNWVVAVAWEKMHKLRIYFFPAGGRPARPAGGLDVENEGRRCFEDTSRFLDGLSGFHQPLRLMEFERPVFLCLEVP